MSDIPIGAPHGDTHLIVYHEDVWFDLPDERRDYCKEVWRTKAKSSGARIVALRLIPDELFPMRGNEKPYIEWQEPIEQTPDCGFHIVAMAIVHVHSESRYVPPVLRAEISRQLEALVGVPHYKIMTQHGDVLETGNR